MRLAQAGASVLGSEQTESNNSGVKKETNTTAASGITDKLKASNFPASILRIGNWEVFVCYMLEFYLCICVSYDWFMPIHK